MEANKINSLLDSTLKEIEQAYNKSRLEEWLRMEAIEINKYENEILLAYGGPTIWLDLNKSLNILPLRRY